MKNYLLVFDQQRNAALTDWGLLLLRVGVGLLMLLGHGWPKLSNFSTMLEQFPDPIGLGAGLSLTLATFAEFLCSILILVGLFTRLASIPLIINMLVALFFVHMGDPWIRQERVLLYLVLYLTLLLAGAGRFSIDDSISKGTTGRPDQQAS